MMKLKLGELARATEAELVGGALPVSVHAVGTDTRSLPRAALFVALRGDNFDGHSFVHKAVDEGAVAVVLDRQGFADIGEIHVPALVVNDTLKALGDIANFLRRAQNPKVVAVTGIVGVSDCSRDCAGF